MDYKRMMMETPEETMRRFERKRKLKEVLCEFGLIAHKVRLGDSTHFAFALATPTGRPIARPCSSEDLAECSQWLASKYPTHFFFLGAERPSVYETHGGEAGIDARYGITGPSNLKALQNDATGQLAATKNKMELYPTTERKSYDHVYGSIRDEKHPGLDVEKRIHERHPTELRKAVDPRDDGRHCERSTPLQIFVSPWDTPLPTDSPNTKCPAGRGRNWNELEMAREGTDRKPERRSGHGHEPLKRSREEDREMGHGEHKERASGHGEHKERASGHGEHRERVSGHGDHRHRPERKDRSIASRHHSSRDGPRSRGRNRRNVAGRTQNQTSKSDEGSGICGQDVSAPTNGPTRDPASRMTVRLMNVEKWDCFKQAGPRGAGPALRGEKIMLESDAESRPQELSTPSRIVSGRLQGLDSSDISLSPEPCALQGPGGNRLHMNGIRRHVESGIPSESRHGLRAIPRSYFGDDRIKCDPPEFIDLGGDPEPREDQDGNQECDIVVADEDLIYPGVKGEKALAWKPSPLYQAPVTPAPEKSESSFDSVCTSANDQDYDDEACEREERAVIRYLRLFADDKSWKEGFESADGLTCDVCNLGGKVKRVPDVKALVSHAKTMKRIKMAEHRGYARAICELMNFDMVALDHVNKETDKTSKKPTDDIIVWPPVLVLENTRTEKGPNGQWKGVDEAELTEVLEVALAHKGSHTFRPICGKNGHKGRVLVEFPPSRQAWVDATTLHKQFKINARGYTEWLAVKPRWRHLGPDSIKDGTDFVRLDDTGNPKRVLYGYLAEPRHMEVFDPTRKYVQNWKIVSKNIL